MFRSMTGFSKSEVLEEGVKVTVEIKSVNGRNLDINCRFPRSLSHRELTIRDIIKQNIARGNLSVNVYVEKDKAQTPFYVDETAALAIYNSLNSLKTKMKMKSAVSLDNVLEFSHHFTQKEEELNDELLWKLTEQTLRKSLYEFIETREKEGSNLLQDVKVRLKTILDIVKKIELLGVERIPTERERLRQKVAQIFDNDDIDEKRIQLEIVLMADKLDISEECVRLYSHLKLFNEMLESDKPVGQKIGFLLQEMNRETNTIGSKINDAQVAHLVVDLKDEIERIREQMLNVE